MEYTKGPWEITETLGKVAITVKHDSIGIAPYAICHIWPYIKDGSPEANAKLIASAPELLEALKKITQIIGGEQCNPNEFVRLVDSLKIAEQAIIKAEGK